MAQAQRAVVRACAVSGCWVQSVAMLLLTEVMQVGLLCICWCLHRCTVQLHPDSGHVLDTGLLWAMQASRMRATECRLTGPTPGSSSATAAGVGAYSKAAVSLVSGTQGPGSDNIPDSIHDVLSHHQHTCLSTHSRKILG
jgi:hypothetical protein